LKLLSTRARKELGSLQAELRSIAAERNLALSRFCTSRDSTTPGAQVEFWLEFLWLNQEYRCAVRKLALYCARFNDVPATECVQRDATF
jgi:hypothetical protein